MAIRIRKIKGELVALCAAKSSPEKDDLYLDDNIHHALTLKFENDFHRMGFLNYEPEKLQFHQIKYCTCGNPSNQGYGYFENNEDLIYMCADCALQIKFEKE